MQPFSIVASSSAIQQVMKPSKGLVHCILMPGVGRKRRAFTGRVLHEILIRVELDIGSKQNLDLSTITGDFASCSK